jgi:hypothetical protein
MLISSSFCFLCQDEYKGRKKLDALDQIKKGKENTQRERERDIGNCLLAIWKFISQ